MPGNQTKSNQILSLCSDLCLQMSRFKSLVGRGGELILVFKVFLLACMSASSEF